MNDKKPPDFTQLLLQLQDINLTVKPGQLYALSDLTSEQTHQLAAIWLKVPVVRRVSILEELEEIYDSDTITSFDAIARLCLTDPEPKVREVALRLLWEEEDSSLVKPFMLILSQDPDDRVKAGAAAALGRFIYLGEVDEISSELFEEALALLVTTYRENPKKLIRQRSLESMGFASRPEIKAIISEAYHSPDKAIVASAFCAMGRSADEDWSRLVLSHIADEDEGIQLEAVRAAGELQISDAKPVLIEFLAQPDLDEELKYTIIWSLSQIGGSDVDELFNTMLDGDVDEDMLEVLEEALDNLAFTNEVDSFDILDVEAADLPLPKTRKEK
jgi:HEAT repeat protein